MTVWVVCGPSEGLEAIDVINLTDWVDDLTGVTVTITRDGVGEARDGEVVEGVLGIEDGELEVVVGRAEDKEVETVVVEP